MLYAICHPLRTLREMSWKRRILVASPSLLLLTGAAVAALMLTAPLSGSTTVDGAASVEWTTVSGVQAQKSAQMSTCSANISGGSLSLTMRGAPGESCTLVGAQLAVKQPNGNTFVIQDLKYGSGVTGAFVKTASDSGCGDPVATNSTNVRVKFTISPSATAGQQLPSAADAGAVVVPGGDFVAANCPSAS